MSRYATKAAALDTLAALLFLVGCAVSIALRFGEDNPSPSAGPATATAHLVVCALLGLAAVSFGSASLFGGSGGSVRQVWDRVAQGEEAG